MGKALVIAEKPSVALDVARALGRFTKKTDFFENDSYVISSAIGHLVELCLPNELDKKRGKWSFQNLPIIPDAFQLKPIEKTEGRFRLLVRLMKRPDVDLIINACDAGREGELIFRYLMRLAGVRKPLHRLWLQSMTTEAIRAAFERLRSDEEMIPLAEAAVCRSESDWLVGINATRAMTAFNSKAGGFQLTPVGRVQTPTLAILTEREQRIRDFQPRTYWELLAEFEVGAGVYRGRWFDEKFQKDNQDEDRRPERLWDLEKANALRAKVLGKWGDITEEKKPVSQAPPLLYDLTSLQREANSRFGFSARRTLQIAQQLYERHKVITYPRTDSRYLPEDYLGTSRQVLGQLQDPTLKPYADRVLQNHWVRPSKRVFDDRKVTDHNAIIPTGQTARNLDDTQQKLFDLIARRFVAVFYPPAQFEVTTRITRVEGEAFKTEGRVIKDPGWMAVYGRQATAEEPNAETLVAITRGERALTRRAEVKENQTKPPPRYTEATLLSAMESAGKLVDDEELREAMSAKGLGTPATRAAIIEGLIQDSYIAREGKDLIATAKGISLITLLRGIGIDLLSSPELTGEWEYKLKLMEHGKLDRPSFMESIKELTRGIVNRAKSFESDVVSGNYVTLNVPCPNCGASYLKEDYRTYHCETCDYRFFKNIASRELSPEEATALVRDRRVGPVEGFRSKTGRLFSAVLVLNDENKPEFAFEQKAIADSLKIDPQVHSLIGKCQVCADGHVYDVGTSYVCSNVPLQKCTFKMSRSILQREIPPEQARKMLVEGKSDVLKGFISKKGRPFDAALRLEKGRIGWEFVKRASRSKARKPAPATVES
ncbi:MAG: DNA topoisomerase III [Verrucomicrobia bacterium]|nr:DNA topoisomerase III [Verrucomicrobiota bacterium]